MKIADTDILLIPGYGGTETGHWLHRWQAKMANAWIVEQQDKHRPSLHVWEETLLKRLEKTTRPVVLVAHSLGCVFVAQAAHRLKDKIRGAYLVAPSDWDREGLIPEFDGATFKPIPMHPLPFRTHLVASRNDPYCGFDRAKAFASAWGSTFQDAGEAGHINMASGHGPWPEGLMSFALFMKRLG
ncbi:RBBP9/YdeN family alpha/beta hydrolase [Roseibium sp. RKSG952]|uniref:RBBP9/YdeN family alpha/beta hydrolase n=1 Tax=Roseibium sp. RKSG952 TaxID=2529384 RepID=UPI0013C55CF4|nr:serine hydrolase family protein [Roseibium sp. RKSG952]